MLKACYFLWLAIKTQHSAAYVQTNFESELIIQKYFWKRKIRRTPLGIVIDPRRSTEKKSSCKRVYLGSRKRLFRTIEIRIHASWNNNNALRLRHTHTPVPENRDAAIRTRTTCGVFRPASWGRKRRYVFLEIVPKGVICTLNIASRTQTVSNSTRKLFLVTLYDSSSSSWYFHVRTREEVVWRF